MQDLVTVVLTTVALAASCCGDAVLWERLNKNDSMLLILDLQDGLYGLARDFDPTVYHNAMIAHSAIGKLFDIPVVMSKDPMDLFLRLFLICKSVVKV